MPVGADDLDRIAQPFGFRRAIGGESFVRLGGEADDPAKPGEVIYADAEKCLCRRWNWYQDARSAVGPGATRVVFTVQALAPNATSAAAATRRLADLLGAHCDARCTTAVADRNQPSSTYRAIRCQLLARLPRLWQNRIQTPPRRTP